MNGTRILLVDDSESTRRLYRRALDGRGFEVIEAANGAEAVRLARTRRPGLIFMDIAMPVLDAWAAIRMLRSSPATAAIPVVVLSGHSSAGDREGAREAGFDAFLSKPCPPKRVIEEAERFLGTAGVAGHV